MTIVSVAYPLFPVSQDSAGGAEQILYLIERGLVRAGHRSLVIAAEGSSISGTLLACPAAGATIGDQDRLRAQQIHRAKLVWALGRERVDAVHFHGLDFPAYLPFTSVPIVATLHLPLTWYKPEAFELKQVQFVCVSHSQRATAPPGRLYEVIENGVDLIDKPSEEGSRAGLLWLGRICPEKGTHIALQVSRELDAELIVAGPVHGFDSHQEYFREYVEPLLDDRRKYVGPVKRGRKIQLLSGAKALLIPSLAAETSSLVAMEAISAGTPVICFRSGALPEIVDHGVTGFVVDSEQEMVEAIQVIDALSSDRCKEIGRARFSAERMVTDYLRLLTSLDQETASRD